MDSSILVFPHRRAEDDADQRSGWIRTKRLAKQRIPQRINRSAFEVHELRNFSNASDEQTVICCMFWFHTHLCLQIPGYFYEPRIPSGLQKRKGRGVALLKVFDQIYHCHFVSHSSGQSMASRRQFALPCHKPRRSSRSNLRMSFAEAFNSQRELPQKKNIDSGRVFFPILSHSWRNPWTNPVSWVESQKFANLVASGESAANLLEAGAWFARSRPLEQTLSKWEPPIAEFLEGSRWQDLVRFFSLS